VTRNEKKPVWFCYQNDALLSVTPKERGVRNPDADPRNPDPVSSVRKPGSDRFPRVHTGSIREPNSDQPRDAYGHSLSDPDRDCTDRRITSCGL
jgi:hypothetical protein